MKWSKDDNEGVDKNNSKNQNKDDDIEMTLLPLPLLSPLSMKWNWRKVKSGHSLIHRVILIVLIYLINRINPTNLGILIIVLLLLLSVVVAVNISLPTKNISIKDIITKNTTPKTDPLSLVSLIIRKNLMSIPIPMILEPLDPRLILTMVIVTLRLPVQLVARNPTLVSLYKTWTLIRRIVR